MLEDADAAADLDSSPLAALLWGHRSVLAGCTPFLRDFRNSIVVKLYKGWRKQKANEGFHYKSGFPISSSRFYVLLFNWTIVIFFCSSWQTILCEISSFRLYFCWKLIFASTVFLAQDFFFLLDYLFSCSLGFSHGASLCSIPISIQVLPRTNNLIKLLSNQ